MTKPSGCYRFRAETNRTLRGHDFYPKTETLGKIPPLYGVDGIPANETVVHLHYFVGGADWYVAELDSESGTAFGWVCIQAPEWGYFNLPELETSVIRSMWVVERDLSFVPRRAGDIFRIATTGRTGK